MKFLYAILCLWGITEFMKKQGLTAWQAPYFCICLGGLLGVANEYYFGEQYLELGLIQGLLVGVVATGLYGSVNQFIDRTKTTDLNPKDDFSHQEVH